MIRSKLVVVSVIVAMATVVSSCVSTPTRVTIITTEITSSPPGASVSLDGQPLGTTPLLARIPKKPSGAPRHLEFTSTNFAEAVDRATRWDKAANYVFDVGKDGYKASGKVIFVDDGIPPAMHFDLQAEDAPAKK